jgi:hypothetical protein
MKRELLICTLCLLPIAAHAEWDTQTLLNNYNAGTLAEKFFIAGILSSVENGMSWADAELINSQPPLLFIAHPPNWISLVNRYWTCFADMYKISPLMQGTHMA